MINLDGLTKLEKKVVLRAGCLNAIMLKNVEEATEYFQAFCGVQAEPVELNAQYIYDAASHIAESYEGTMEDKLTVVNAALVSTGFSTPKLELVKFEVNYRLMKGLWESEADCLACINSITAEELAAFTPEQLKSLDIVKLNVYTKFQDFDGIAEVMSRLNG